MLSKINLPDKTWAYHLHQNLYKASIDCFIKVNDMTFWASDFAKISVSVPLQKNKK